MMAGPAGIARWVAWTCAVVVMVSSCGSPPSERDLEPEVALRTAAERMLREGFRFEKTEKMGPDALLTGVRADRARSSGLFLPPDHLEREWSEGGTKGWTVLNGTTRVWTDLEGHVRCASDEASGQTHAASMLRFALDARRVVRQGEEVTFEWIRGSTRAPGRAKLVDGWVEDAEYTYPSDAPGSHPGDWVSEYRFWRLGGAKQRAVPACEP